MASYRGLTRVCTPERDGGVNPKIAYSRFPMTERIFIWFVQYVLQLPTKITTASQIDQPLNLF